MRRLLASCFVLALLVTALPRVAHADPLDDETRRIAKQLQCPVCSGQPVSDSPAELAGQMRSVIRARLEAGETEEQIIAYFVERYGDGVLIEPPRRGIGLAVWLAPLGVLAVGAVLLWRLLRSWLRPRRTPSLVSGTAPAASISPAAPYRNGTAHAETPAPVSSVDRARAELDRFRREG
jgi:cytochrome c-type biogenesis protein CcmH/NrfF